MSDEINEKLDKILQMLNDDRVAYEKRFTKLETTNHNTRLFLFGILAIAGPIVAGLVFRII